MPPERPIFIATRGSALALAQAQHVLAQCRAAFPRLMFDLKIIKTTGDKLQSQRPEAGGESLPKGLFTKELEVALLKHQADLAVHSLKDLPTELPAGLVLGAVGKRADVREVLIYRDAEYLRRIEASDTVGDWSPGHSRRRGHTPQATLKDLPQGWTVATGSPRRQAQLHAVRPDLNIVPIRGNVPTRLQKLADEPEMDAIMLAAAGLERLNFQITPQGHLQGDAVPDGQLAIRIPLDVMLPCVGQGAVGIEIRQDDGRIAAICERLNHYNTRQAVEAERAFLRAMGGGCQSPVAAFAEASGTQLRMSVVSFLNNTVQRAQAAKPLADAVALGESLAAQIKA